MKIQSALPWEPTQYNYNLRLHVIRELGADEVVILNVTSRLRKPSSENRGGKSSRTEKRDALFSFPSNPLSHQGKENTRSNIGEGICSFVTLGRLSPTIKISVINPTGQKLSTSAAQPVSPHALVARASKSVFNHKNDKRG